MSYTPFRPLQADLVELLKVVDLSTGTPEHNANTILAVVIGRLSPVIENQALLHRIIDMMFNEEESLFLRGLDDGLIHAYMVINDVFMWGCADLEEITAENVDAFEQALKDVLAMNPLSADAKPDGRNFQIGSDAGVLFACRNRKQRPFKHEGTYPVHASVVPLIEALPFPDNTRRGPTIAQLAKIESGVELSQTIEDLCGQPPEAP